MEEPPILVAEKLVAHLDVEVDLAKKDGEKAIFEIFDKKADTAELLLSACVDILTGKWVLAPAAEFRSRCGGIHAGGLLPESGLHHAPMKSRHAAGSP